MIVESYSIFVFVFGVGMSVINVAICFYSCCGCVAYDDCIVSLLVSFGGEKLEDRSLCFFVDGT